MESGKVTEPRPSPVRVPADSDDAPICSQTNFIEIRVDSAVVPKDLFPKEMIMPLILNNEK